MYVSIYYIKTSEWHLAPFCVRSLARTFARRKNSKKRKSNSLLIARGNKAIVGVRARSQGPTGDWTAHMGLSLSLSLHFVRASSSAFMRVLEKREREELFGMIRTSKANKHRDHPV